MREMPSASRARLTSDNECKHEEGERDSVIEREIRSRTLANVCMSCSFDTEIWRIDFSGEEISRSRCLEKDFVAEILGSPFRRVSSASGISYGYLSREIPFGIF